MDSDAADLNAAGNSSAETTVLNNHAIAIQDGIIIALASLDQILNDYPSAKHTELKNHILLPGLINTHSHTAMTLLRGMADDYPLMEWLAAPRQRWPHRLIALDYVYFIRRL